jgi:signal transduction histidine kinase
MNLNHLGINQNIDASSPRPEVSSIGWNSAWNSDHVVQFYDAEETLLSSLFYYVQSGLKCGEACIIVAKQDHRDSLDERLMAAGFDLESYSAKGKYVSLDAATMLSKFMVNGVLQQGVFDELVGGMIAEAAKAHGRVRIYGEMVALLWADGNYDIALQLEDFWNRLQKANPFLLLCGYPITHFGGDEMVEPFHHVCNSHSHIIPAESDHQPAYSEKNPIDIAQLQEKKILLQNEILRQKRAEENFIRINHSNDDVLLAVAQEIRSHATLIQNTVERLRLNQPQILQHEDVRQLIERQVTHILKITFDVLDFVKFNNGKYSLDRERVDLVDIISEAIETTRPLINRRKQKLSISPLPSVQIEMNSMRVVQAFSNFLEHAATVTDEGGILELSAEQNDRTVQIRIKDQGPSIPTKPLPAAIDLLTKGYHAHGHPLQGMGIGVSLAIKIIELHGGRVEAFSFGLGVGNEVVVILPLSS